MSYSRFALGFTRSRKVFALSDAAFRLWVSSIDRSREERSDGHIIPSDLDAIPRCPPAGKRRSAVVAEIVGQGLWHERSDGWQIHDFLDWQDSSDEANKRRAAARERMRRVRANSRRTAGERSANVTYERSGEVRDGSDLDQEVNSKTTSKDLSGRRPREPETTQPGATVEHRTRCPKNLWTLMPEDSKGTLETSLIPRWAQEQVCAGYVAGYIAKPNETRTLEQWLSGLVTAIQSRWHDPKRRPRQPTSDGPDEDAEMAARFS